MTRNGWRTVVAGALLALAVVVVLIAAFFDTERVETKADESHVDLGWPLDWTTWDNSAHDPSLPYDLGVGNPRDDAVAAHLAPFLVDVALLWVPALAGGALLDVVLWRRQGVLEPAPF